MGLSTCIFVPIRHVLSSSPRGCLPASVSVDMVFTLWEGGALVLIKGHIEGVLMGFVVKRAVLVFRVLGEALLGECYL